MALHRCCAGHEQRLHDGQVAGGRGKVQRRVAVRSCPVLRVKVLPVSACMHTHTPVTGKCRRSLDMQVTDIAPLDPDVRLGRP